MKLLSRDRKNVSYFVDASLEARLHVSSGEQFEVETIRADDCFLTEQNPYFKNHEHVMSIRANPVTGPIYIENAKPGDIEVNPIKGKKLTNMRAAGKDENVILTPPTQMSLEEALAYINEDELVEVTPNNIRLRKKLLDSNDRRKFERGKLS